jgi:hypothetical protein
VANRGFVRGVYFAKDTITIGKRLADDLDMSFSRVIRTALIDFNECRQKAPAKP